MRVAVLALTLPLLACAAREAHPVAISQPGDAELTCEQMAEEIARNEAEALRLAEADKKVVESNIGAGVAGTLIFWPALLATDLSNAEQIRLRALRDRNANLERLRGARGC